ncbi:MAG: hypothetical protein HXN48_01280 [Prevotella nanceiensis]|uniref:hypothetical protein n=1 Tax=Hoylesella nanceiensis TaxID=425941 RepID=UPI001CAF79EB|nr:hypothetical protein [Hoylesella nanceiensis]MBF1437056.1 hypothetical protein [Hoylesella nanceiensis]
MFKYFMVFEERANSVSSSMRLICNKKDLKINRKIDAEKEEWKSPEIAYKC